MLIVSLVVAALAVTRLTRLVVDDQITIGFRRWIFNKLGEDHSVSYLITCPWCSSVWIAAMVMPVATLWPNRWVIGALSIPAASLIAGRLLEKD